TAAAVTLDRMRYRHELQVRWDIKKSEAITAYLDAAVTMARSAGRAAGCRGWDLHSAVPGTLEEAIAAVEAAEARRSPAFEAVVLLANHRTIHAGHELNKALWLLEWLADGRRNSSEAIWSADRNRFQAALQEFHTAMREDLKVPGAGPSEVVTGPDGSRASSTAVDRGPRG
ncbi:MAG TPA: hypothetical protein VF518_14430, partial [Polyangia bacterium]